jgi:uncharacterized protein YjiS (DUF1127 family)
MLQRNRNPQPASTRPRHTAFQSKSRAQNKDTMAMKNIFQTIRQWQRGKAAARMLNRMDDHMLADIGVARADISKAVHIFH